jgi:hypothetical protein
LPSVEEPDPDREVTLGDQRKMQLFETSLFNSRLDPDPNEVKQGAAAVCPLPAVLIATAHVLATKQLLLGMVNEVKKTPGWVFLTRRTREEFEYKKLPQNYYEKAKRR